MWSDQCSDLWCGCFGGNCELKLDYTCRRCGKEPPTHSTSSSCKAKPKSERRPPSASCCRRTRTSSSSTISQLKPSIQPHASPNPGRCAPIAGVRASNCRPSPVLTWDEPLGISSASWLNPSHSSWSSSSPQCSPQSIATTWPPSSLTSIPILSLLLAPPDTINFGRQKVIIDNEKKNQYLR